MKISNVKRKAMQRRNKQADELLDVIEIGDDDEMIKLWLCNGDCDDENDNCFDYRDDECVDPRELKCFGMSKRKYDLMSLRKLATQLLYEEVNLLPNFNTDIVKNTKMILDAIVSYIENRCDYSR